MRARQTKTVTVLDGLTLPAGGWGWPLSGTRRLSKFGAPVTANKPSWFNLLSNTDNPAMVGDDVSAIMCVRDSVTDMGKCQLWGVSPYGVTSSES